MDIAELKSRVLAKHAGNPQRHGLADLHLNELERALAGLAAIGENISLEFGGAPATIQYPKMLFHSKELHPKVVESSEEEEEARKAGWNEFPGGVAPTGQVSMPGVANPAPAPVAPPKVTVGVGGAAPATKASTTKGG